MAVFVFAKVGKGCRRKTSVVSVVQCNPVNTDTKGTSIVSVLSGCRGIKGALRENGRNTCFINIKINADIFRENVV